MVINIEKFVFYKISSSRLSGGKGMEDRTIKVEERVPRREEERVGVLGNLLLCVRYWKKTIKYA